MRRFVTFLLIIVFCCGFLGCTTELEERYLGKETLSKEMIATWSADLFRSGFELEENYLISPLSVLLALSMTVNGAAEETLWQMEQVLGAKKEHLNAYFLNNLPALRSEDLQIANSIWLNQNEVLEVVPQFLELNQTYYQAQINQERFNFRTAKNINGWVKKHTGEMIEKIIDEVDPDSVLYLINAIAFDAQWEEAYPAEQIHEDYFTNYRQEKTRVKLMQSEESIYLEDQKARGFIKPYAGGKYSFVAILPADLEEYVREMKGETILNFLNSARKVKVDAYLPRFSYDYGCKLNDVLIALGMEQAFQPTQADFSQMAKIKGENIYIDEVLHKTFIEVDEKGTKAAAVTSVGIITTTAIQNEERQQVKLDRPFLYLIIDEAASWPVFMGAVIDLEV